MPLGIFLFAAAVRTIPWRRVFTGGGVVFSDGDSYHHMWRIWNAASGSLHISHGEARPGPGDAAESRDYAQQPKVALPDS